MGRHRPRDRCTGDRRRRSRRPRPGAQPELTPRYQFRTIDNDNDPTFNQLLGINQRGLIAGYFGSGAQGHPNQGYLLSAHHGQAHYVSENWPESTQTQVTGLNDRGTTVGFWSSTNNANMATNDNRAFVTDNGYFIDGDYPATTPAAPPVDQLLGVNDHNVAVGVYTESAANTHAYSFDIRPNSFKEITPVGITNPTGSAINNQGDVAGFGTSNGQVVGYLLSRDGSVTTLNVPGSSMTQAIGIAHRNARETGPPRAARSLKDEPTSGGGRAPCRARSKRRRRPREAVHHGAAAGADLIAAGLALQSRGADGNARRSRGGSPPSVRHRLR